MSKTKVMTIEWENIPFSFSFPRFYFYLHDNCSYCKRFITRVPELSCEVDKLHMI